MNHYEAKLGCQVWAHPTYGQVRHKPRGPRGRNESPLIIDLGTTRTLCTKAIVCTKSRAKEGFRHPGSLSFLIGPHLYYWTMLKWVLLRKP